VGTGVSTVDRSPPSPVPEDGCTSRDSGGGGDPLPSGEGGFSRLRELRMGENTDRRAVTWAAALHSMPKVCALGARAAARMPARGYGGPNADKAHGVMQCARMDNRK
jgi:hypothetical protein